MKQQDLVLLGGGHTHVLLIRSLAMRPIPGVRVTLVSEQTLTPYSGMLPGYVAGHYSLQETNIDLNQLCRRAGVRWIKARVYNLDPQARVLMLGDQADLQFDQLSIDVGSTPDLSIPGAEQYAVGVKPISSFQQRWQTLLETSNSNHLTKQNWAVIGAGAGGVELVLAMAHRMRDHTGLQFHLVFRGDRLLADYPSRVATAVERRMHKLGVSLHPNFNVAEVSAEALISERGEQLDIQQSIWCTGATGASWLADSGLACSNRGFVEVNRFLQSTSHPHIFAVGDIADMLADPRPKAGVFAVRQAPPLEENLRRVFSNKPLQTVKLQRQFLSMLSLGDRSAVASRNGLVVTGDWVWRWKNHIDQKFMQQFSNFKAEMSSQESDQAETMHCAGCGSKLGPELLKGNLEKLGLIDHNQADDATLWTPTANTISAQSIDGFRSFTTDEYRLGRICANHAMSDIQAMGAQPTIAQAWINLEFNHPRIQQRDHLRVLKGIIDSLEPQGAKLRGGHSSEGEEAHLALVVNGELKPESAWNKGGLQAGDWLLLDKALGTGIILAADMQGEAPANAVDAAFESMLENNHQSMQQLLNFAPSAVTDVTGFGLIGHLLEMIDASHRSAANSTEISVSLNLGEIPLIEGALELAGQGWRSSLQPQLEPLLERCEVPTGSNVDLLLDPQTSGGLLVALAEKKARELLNGDSRFVRIGTVNKKFNDADIIISE